jgi:hypothetical protein
LGELPNREVHEIRRRLQNTRERVIKKGETIVSAVPAVLKVVLFPWPVERWMVTNPLGVLRKVNTWRPMSMDWAMILICYDHRKCGHGLILENRI